MLVRRPGRARGSRPRSLRRRQPDVFERQKAEVLEITTHGDKLLVHAKFYGSFSESGIELEQPGWQLWTIRDGLGAKLEVFLDREVALNAAGPGG